MDSVLFFFRKIPELYYASFNKLKIILKPMVATKQSSLHVSTNELILLLDVENSILSDFITNKRSKCNY